MTVAATLRKDNYRDEVKAPRLGTQGIDIESKTPLYEKRVEWGTLEGTDARLRASRLGLHVDTVYYLVPLL